MSKKLATIVAILGVEALSLKTPLFGGKPTAQLTEEQLEIIEEALVKSNLPTEALQTENEKLKAQLSENEDSFSNFKKVVGDAMALNNLQTSEDLSANITLLGKTCKEYGDKNTSHTLPTSDGKDDEKGEFAGIVNMNDAHNQ